MTTKPRGAGIDRRSGVAVWRQIADEMRQAIAAGTLGADGRLPTEAALSSLFGVNRHTVRSAIAALSQEGILRAERGRGTFIDLPRRYAYPIGSRTRFSEGLAGQARERTTRLLGHAVESAPADIASALGIGNGAQVIRMETRGEADGRPLSRATNWLEADRFAGIEKAFRGSGSMTFALAACGVTDYSRRSTIVAARHATDEDRRDLGLAAGGIVLVARGLNVDADGRPIHYAVTRFAADRVEIVLGGADQFVPGPLPPVSQA